MAMEAYYMRRTAGGVGVSHDKWSTTDCVYFPHQKLALYGERQGAFSVMVYSICTDPKILKEMQSVIEGGFDNRGEVSYGFLKKMEVDQKEAMSLIEDARKEKALRRDVEGGIEKLIEKGRE